MIDHTIVQLLKENNGDIGFDCLINFMNDNNIEVKNHRLKDIIGIATYDCVYLDMDKVMRYNTRMVWYIILHEIAHFKRIAKMGKAWVVEMLSLEDFDGFVSAIIKEEMLADRYACFVYRLLLKETFPIEATQCLHMAHKKEDYKKSASRLYGFMNHDENNYEKLLNSFLI